MKFELKIFSKWHYQHDTLSKNKISWNIKNT